MLCPKCGRGAAGQFCSNCGSPTSPAAQAAGVTTLPKTGVPQRPRSFATEWRSSRRFRIGALSLLGLIIIVIGVAIGAGSSSKTSSSDLTQNSGDAGSENFAQGYALPSDVDRALTKHFEDRGSTVEYHKCSYFAPNLGGAPVYNCTFKVDNVWHDDIQGTGHPDGTFSWDDYTSGLPSLR